MEVLFRFYSAFAIISFIVTFVARWFVAEDRTKGLTVTVIYSWIPAMLWPFNSIINLYIVTLIDGVKNREKEEAEVEQELEVKQEVDEVHEGYDEGYERFIHPNVLNRTTDDRSARRAYGIFTNPDSPVLRSCICDHCSRVMTPDVEHDRVCPRCRVGNIHPHKFWGRHFTVSKRGEKTHFVDNTMLDLETTVNQSELNIILHWIPRGSVPGSTITLNNLQYWLAIAIRAHQESLISTSRLRDVVMALRACGITEVPRSVLKKIQEEDADVV